MAMPRGDMANNVEVCGECECECACTHARSFRRRWFTGLIRCWNACSDILESIYFSALPPPVHPPVHSQRAVNQLHEVLASCPACCWHQDFSGLPTQSVASDNDIQDARPRPPSPGAWVTGKGLAAARGRLHCLSASQRRGRLFQRWSMTGEPSGRAAGGT